MHIDDNSLYRLISVSPFPIPHRTADGGVEHEPRCGNRAKRFARADEARDYEVGFLAGSSGAAPLYVDSSSASREGCLDAEKALRHVALLTVGAEA